MLPKVIPHKMLPYLIIILLTLAQDGLMVSKSEQQHLLHYSENPSPPLSPFEMDAPHHMEALGSRLTVRIRLSPSPSSSSYPNGTGNLAESFLDRNGINARELFLQLGFYDQSSGDRVMLTQKKLKTAISTNWQDVDFDCGWIVRGGKYFVYLFHHAASLSSESSESDSDYLDNYSTLLSSETSSSSSPPLQHSSSPSSIIQSSSHVNQSESNESEKDNDGGDDDGVITRVRMLAKRTIEVTYPRILFEVPSRLETYATAAPVTFALTKTICKPKLKLPSTLLTLTMCSRTSHERSSGPNARHFSSSHSNDDEDHQSGGDENHYHGGNVDGAGAPENAFVGGRSTHKEPPGSSSGHHHHESSRQRDHHLRRYNPNHHLSSPSVAGLPQRSRGGGRRQNHSEDSRGSFQEAGSRIMCHRDVSTVFQDPLIALQTEGRVTINVECHLWGRNATYVIQLCETQTRNVIAQSSFISVEWSSQFSLELSKTSVLRCQGSIRAQVSYPRCILPGRDKIRVYGYETLPVPSLLAPSRMSYIGEQQIRNNNRIISFRCSIFPARFLRFCFQYVNTAVDESVAVVMEKCIPTGPASKIADGGWSEWSNWSSCSVTCGSGGKRFRYRFCDSPPPTSGANFCQGGAIQEEPCDTGIPCPIVPLRRPPLSGDGSEEPPSVRTTPSGMEARMSGGRDGHHRKYLSGSGRPSFMDFSVLNVSTTPGCECGCILYDLIPSKNYSLVILISANQSSCADEDEEDHHNFRWILHAKNENDRIRLDIVGMDVQCVTMTFRDGNTTDSNLLEVITASQPSDPIQFEGLYERELGQRQATPNYSQQSGDHYDDDDEDDDSSDEDSEERDGDDDDDEEGDVNGEGVYDRHEDGDESSDMNVKGSQSILRIDSTGPSLSIGTTSDSSKNCSGQFIYFIAYYTTIRSPVTGIAERKKDAEDYDFWTFLFLKLVVLFFVVVVLCSTMGGFVTKLYRKYKYKELKCFENDDMMEEGSSLHEDGNGGGGGRKGTRDLMRDDTSRCTSITLMSFDYSYWRRLRILRLKYFLLRPRPLDPVTTKIKSFPNTPTVSTRRKENGVGAHTSAGQPPNKNTSTHPKSGRRRGGVEEGDETVSKMRKNPGDDAPANSPLLHVKPISLSETNLRAKSTVLAVTKDGYEVRHPLKRHSRLAPGDNDYGKEDSTKEIDIMRSCGGGVGDPKRERDQDHLGSASDMYSGDGNASLTSTSVSISMSQSLNGSETASSNSRKTPTPVFLDDGCKREGGKGHSPRDELRSGAIKLLKEQENLLRKSGGKKKVSGDETLCLTHNSLSKDRNNRCGGLHPKEGRGKQEKRDKGKRKLILQHGNSTSSVSTVQSARASKMSSSTCDEESSSRVASRADLEDTDQDFEMDYYDYDVMNAGNIPGSYLGLEPAFVLWNSDMYPHSGDEDAEGGPDGSPLGSALHLTTSEDKTHCGGGAMDDSAYGIEMTSSSSSIGMFSGESGSTTRKEFGMKETSLDTLKFADDDDDDYDDEEMESFIADKSAESIPLKSAKECGQLNKYNGSSISSDLGKS